MKLVSKVDRECLYAYESQPIEVEHTFPVSGLCHTAIIGLEDSGKEIFEMVCQLRVESASSRIRLSE